MEAISNVKSSNIESSNVESMKKEPTDDRYIVKAVPKVFGNVESLKDGVGVGPAVNVEGNNAATTTPLTVDEPAAVIEEQIKTTESFVDDTDVNATLLNVDGSSILTPEPRSPETPNKTEPDIPSFR